jgi:hypothetical protein
VLLVSLIETKKKYFYKIRIKLFHNMIKKFFFKGILIRKLKKK